MNLHNRAAVVTGAASGIGAEIARLFLEAGAGVVAVDRSGPPFACGSLTGNAASQASMSARVPLSGLWPARCRTRPSRLAPSGEAGSPIPLKPT